jgi:hypothetical protein
MQLDVFHQVHHPKFYFGEMNPQPLEKVAFLKFFFQNSKWIIMVSNDARFCIMFSSTKFGKAGPFGNILLGGRKRNCTQLRSINFYFYQTLCWPKFFYKSKRYPQSLSQNYLSYLSYNIIVIDIGANKKLK